MNETFFKRLRVSGIAAVLTLFVLTGTAFATSNVGFNVQCPGMRGYVSTIEKGFSGTKTVTGSSMLVKNCYTSGGHNVDACQINDKGDSGAWEAGYCSSIASMYLSGTNSIQRGQTVGIGFRTELLNFDNTNVTGTFDTN